MSMMKITVVYSLILVFQLLWHCDAREYTVTCRQLQHVSDATISDIQPGSSIRFRSHRRSCNRPGNGSYTLLQQNHHTGQLEVVSQQQDHKFVISDIQLSTSGVYCAYKDCVPEEMEQCCIQIMVTPKMDLIVPDKAGYNTQQRGICYVKAFPLFTPDEIHVSTDEHCAITKHPVTSNSSYTTAIFFTLDNINSYCQRISCLTQIHEEVKHISITPTTVSSISPSSSIVPTISTPATTPGCLPSATPTAGLNTTPLASGTLGIYRITTRTITLIFTVLIITIILPTP